MLVHDLVYKWQDSAYLCLSVLSSAPHYLQPSFKSLNLSSYNLPSYQFAFEQDLSTKMRSTIYPVILLVAFSFVQAAAHLDPRALGKVNENPKSDWSFPPPHPTPFPRN
jgi:hypothetical protein